MMMNSFNSNPPAGVARRNTVNPKPTIKKKAKAGSDFDVFKPQVQGFGAQRIANQNNVIEANKKVHNSAQKKKGSAMVIGNAPAAALNFEADLLVVPAKLERRPSDSSKSPKSVKSNGSGSPSSPSRKRQGTPSSKNSKEKSPRGIEATEFNLMDDEMEFERKASHVTAAAAAGPLNAQNSEIVIPTAPLKQSDKH